MSDDTVYTFVRAMLRQRGWVRLRNILWWERWRDPVTGKACGFMKALDIDSDRRRAEQAAGVEG